MKLAGVVDYKAGNLRSVENALKYLGARFIVSDKPEPLAGCDTLVFPGVGDAAFAMDILRRSGLGEAIREFFASGKPILGICLGSQIVLQRSEEGDTECLGIIRGTAPRFPRFDMLKVPHMGWNQVVHRGRHPIFGRIKDGSSFYFVHSYYPKPESDSCIASETEYGIRFASAIAYKNLVATQFHPEKSGEVGLALLSGFLEWEP